MRPRGDPLFVHRRAYRRRRLADAARLLPVLGAILFLIPLLWKDGEGARTARVIAYLFPVWAGLAVLSGVLSRYLRSDEDVPEGDGDR